MQVKVIRGSDQIGGSIIEVVSHDARIILDVGSEFGEEKPEAPVVEGLFQGEKIYDAVLLSHYHGDHIGLMDDVLEGIPLYMGEKAFAVYTALTKYAGKDVRKGVRTFIPNEKFMIGDICVTPILCDHSAFDSYMYLVEADGEKVLYTGDFRSNGRKNFDRLLSRLPRVDKLIVEGTTLTGSHAMARTEADLEDEAVQIIKEALGKPVFTNMASTNLDRIVTFYRAAKRTGRVFLEDTYTASIAHAIGGSIPNPDFDDVKVFLSRPTDRDYAILQKFPKAKISKVQVAKKKFVMMVRPSMARYLEKLAMNMDFDGGVLFYSLWSGYKKVEYTRDFIERMEALGLRVVDLHASGHADMQAIERLIEKTRPKEIIPVHTEYSAWFERFK